jgi:hypothetical protein
MVGLGDAEEAPSKWQAPTSWVVDEEQPGDQWLCIDGMTGIKPDSETPGMKALADSHLVDVVAGDDADRRELPQPGPGMQSGAR